MGRHGGGSRSGGGGGSSGSSRSSSSGGSRSGGSSTISSNKPFAGCYNRSYYDRLGRYHSYYTSDSTFGTRNGWNIGIIFFLLFITIHMILMVGGFTVCMVDFGSKVNGNQNRIFIEDRIDLLEDDEEKVLIRLFEKVYETILDRKHNPKEGSYTNYLFEKGIDKILKKVGEEATELVIAAKNPNPEEIKYELSDFLYHAMVLMVERGVTWDDIVKELADR